MDGVFILFVKHYKGGFSLQKCNKHNGVVDKESMQERWPGVGMWLMLAWDAIGSVPMLSHAYNPQIQEAGVGRRIRSSEFGARLGHLRPCLRPIKRKPK